MAKPTIEQTDAPQESVAVSNIEVISLANYVRPKVQEVAGTNYVLNGKKNAFYGEILDRYNGSPTNKAIIDGYGKFIYGRGLIATNANRRPLQWARFVALFSKKDGRRSTQEYYLFGEGALELIYVKGVLDRIKFVQKQKIVPGKMTPDGDIDTYWFSMDFAAPTKAENKPREIKAWSPGGKKNGSYIYIVSDYQAGKTYFTDPVYLPGMPYARLEEEIANYSVNHIQNGLSIAHILNMNNGPVDSEEVKRKTRANFIENATGSVNAGRFVMNYCDKDKGIEAVPLTVSDAHKQYERLSEEATQKLMIAHRVTSPMLFGIKDSTGLGNNANEMEVAFDELMTNVIQPLQEVYLDCLMEILHDAGIMLDLEFSPLRKPAENSNANGVTRLSADDDKDKDEDPDMDASIAEALIELGEVMDPEVWELVDERKVDGIPKKIDTLLQLASVPSSFPSVKSEQDTDLFKVRFTYAGSLDPQREFCSKMMGAGKVYRQEDIDLASDKVVNPGFGPYGADKYNIWLYKGGANCHHFWQRRVYLRKSNKQITAAEARKMINDLDPSERKKNRFKVNNPLVAKLPTDMPNNGYLSARKGKKK